MANVGNLDFKAFVEDRKKARVGGGDDAPHAYAYVSDHTTRRTFEKIKPVELAISAAVRMFKSVGKAQLLGQAVKIGPNQFPRLHAVARECAETLGIATPTLYVTSNPTLNAATYGTNEDSFIIVHSGLVDALNDAELHSVIGHECGHIHNKHVVYLTTMHLLTQMASRFVGWIIQPAVLALNAWSRRAEITCDRAGLLCTKDLDASTRALAKLAVGSEKLFEQMNLEAFIEQVTEIKDSAGRYTEAFSTHPWLPKRVLALRAFAESELYKKHMGIEGPGLTMPQVDEKVHGIIKVWE
jgi:Zn-dependent protease with chaperone function